MTTLNSAAPAPLILTLALDAASQTFFDELRRRHFPPARNFLRAHLTLFHALPGGAQPEITGFLRSIGAGQSPLTLEIAGVQFMGQGVMYKLESPALRRLHQTLQTAWQTEFGFSLSGQDRQPLHPHITVQNKVSTAAARALHEKLSADFQPFQAMGTGLRLWEYQGGPWKELRNFEFETAIEG